MQQTQAADIVLQRRNDRDVLRLNREGAEVSAKKIQASTGILGPHFLRTARKIGKNGGIARSLSDYFLSCPFDDPGMLSAYRHQSGIQDSDPGHRRETRKERHSSGR
jgi:hypothetical protein